MMRIVGVPQELWYPEEFASENLVIKLVIHGTIKKLVEIYISNGCYIAVVFFALYLMQIILFAVNAKYAPWEERVMYHWASPLCFIRFDCCVETMKKNQRSHGGLTHWAIFPLSPL